MPLFDRDTTGKEVVESFPLQVAEKTFLITGPSKGSIGAETAISLAYGSPATILLLGRTKSKVVPVITKINDLNPAIDVRFVQVDLASQESVRLAAEQINNLVQKIDYIINTAGVMALPEFSTTKEGIELQFGSNHIGHFLLTNLLIPKVLAAGAGSRIVNVASTGFELGGVRFDDYNFKEGKEYKPWLAYAQSKTANVLYSAGLAERLMRKGVQSFAVQPGFVQESNLSAHVTNEIWAQVTTLAKDEDVAWEAPKSLQQGCSTSLVAALDTSIADRSGGFLQDCVVRPVGKGYAESTTNVEKLWQLSENLVGQKFVLT